MTIHDPESIKAMVKRLGEICLLAEQHALAGTQLPGMSHGYENKDERDAYLIGMRRQNDIMRGEL